MAATWNLHRIRPCNGDTPPGKLDILFFVPHEAGARGYKVNVCENDLVLAENMCGNRSHPLGCSPLFVHLAELIMEDNSLQMPRNPKEALSLFIELLYHIDNILYFAKDSHLQFRKSYALLFSGGCYRQVAYKARHILRLSLNKTITVSG